MITFEVAEAKIRARIDSGDPDGLLSLGIDLAPDIGLSLDALALDLFDESPSVARYDAVCLLIGGLWCRGVRCSPIDIAVFRRLLKGSEKLALSEQAAGSLLIAIAEGSLLLNEDDKAKVAENVCSLIEGNPRLFGDQKACEIFANLGISGSL